jgi:hypothetical protein
MKGSWEFSLVILFLNCNLLLYSTPSDTTSIIDNIYNYNFSRASEQLSEMNVKNPLISKTLDLEISWWMAMEKVNEGQFTEFLSKLNQFEKTGNNELAGIISSTYRMRYYACVKKTFKVPFLFLKIRKQIENVGLAGLGGWDNEESELFVLYRSFLTLIQNNIFIGKYLQGSDRNQELIGNIENVIRNGSSQNKTMGRYFLMKYYSDIEKDKHKADRYLAELHRQYPQNIVFTRLLTN